MLRTYHWKMFTSYYFNTKISVSLYQKGWQFSCHLIAGRNVKDLSLENVHLILLKYENMSKFIPKGVAVQLHICFAQFELRLLLCGFFLF